MCYSEPLYEERKKQLNSTTNVSISEEISSGLYIYIYIYIYIIPKTKKFGCLGRGDLTFLFKSCEMYESQGRLI